MAKAGQAQRPHPARLMISGRGHQSRNAVAHYVAGCAVLVMRGDGLVESRDSVAVVADAYARLSAPTAGTIRVLAAPVMRICRAAGNQNEDEFAMARHDLRRALAAYFAGELVI